MVDGEAVCCDEAGLAVRMLARARNALLRHAGDFISWAGGVQLVMAVVALASATR